MLKNWKEFFIPILAIFLALILAGIFIILSGKNPLTAYKALYLGSFGNIYSLSETLLKTIPLILTGLSVAFAFRGGLFNIGGEGQFLIGGFTAGFVGFTFSLPSFIHIPLALLAGFLAASLYAALAGYLKARLGVHEVINTIMLNWIALYLVTYLVNNPFKDLSGMGSPLIKESALLPALIPQSRLHIGLLIVLILTFIVWYILKYTPWGYEVKALGFSPKAAEYGKINLVKNIVLILAFSGGLAGIAGSMEYLGVLGRIPSTLWFSGYGFDGIAVALVGKNNPAGVVLSSLLFGALRTGGNIMQRDAQISKDIVGIIQALVIILVVAPEIIRTILPFLKRKSENICLINNP
ncbi:MAG: ABC transporter permease [Armatimonadetes bacterium]|nr:ABC transporter permease [Armatimonadota bacterium]